MPKETAEEKPKATPKAKTEAVEVKLKTDNPPSTHTVYLPKARVVFENGTTKVTPEVADELRKLGIIE